MKYEIMETIAKNDVGQNVSTYGIRCAEGYVEDLSGDKDAVLDLVSRCNKYGLNPVQLRDVAEDFLHEISS